MTLADNNCGTLSGSKGMPDSILKLSKPVINETPNLVANAVLLCETLRALCALCGYGFLNAKDAKDSQRRAKERLQTKLHQYQT
jgi:hypothetical protein